MPLPTSLPHAPRGGRLRRRRVVAPVLLLALLLTGCSDDDPGGSEGQGTTPKPAGTAERDGRAAGPGVQASAFPVPASASPTPLPDLGTRSGQGWTFTLNAVRRVADETVVVEGTLTSESATSFRGFEETGYSLIPDSESKLANTYEFGAVTLGVAGDPKVYQPLRDERGRCACTAGIYEVSVGKPLAVYVYLTAPREATTVNVTVARFAPFTGVAVTS